MSAGAGLGERIGLNYPDSIETHLSSVSFALTAGFNRRGTLLAVGSNDGRIIIWDFQTKKFGKVLSAHIYPISSVGWSRDGRRIVSSSSDCTVCVSDVISGDVIKTFRFSSPILTAQFNPRDSDILIACPLNHRTLLLTLGGTREAVPVQHANAPDGNIFAAFDRRGKYIFTGNGKGYIEVYAFDDEDDLELVANFRSGTTSVKGFEFARHGSNFLVNSKDRVLRVYDVETILGAGKDSLPIEPKLKLQDSVNRISFVKCSFSGDGELVCAGSASRQNIYIWDIQSGSLLHMLHGTNGGKIMDVAWHPLAPVIASVGVGIVTIWSRKIEHYWTSYVPGFTEIDENEYEERESDFDEEDEDKDRIRKQMKANLPDPEDVELDVVNVYTMLSSDEEEEDSKMLVILREDPTVEHPEYLFGSEHLPVSENAREENKRKRRKVAKKRAGEKKAQKRSTGNTRKYRTPTPESESEEKSNSSEDEAEKKEGGNEANERIVGKCKSPLKLPGMEKTRKRYRKKFRHITPESESEEKSSSEDEVQVENGEILEEPSTSYGRGSGLRVKETGKSRGRMKVVTKLAPAPTAVMNGKMAQADLHDNSKESGSKNEENISPIPTLRFSSGKILEPNSNIPKKKKQLEKLLGNMSSGSDNSVSDLECETNSGKSGSE